MSELRKDPVTGRWVIISTERSKRLSDFQLESVAVTPDDGCPFCEGHEHMTPRELLSRRRDGSHADGPGWDLRVVPNQFPVLRVEGTLDRRGEGLFDRMNGIGAHEVIIESPRHRGDAGDDGGVGGGAGAGRLPRPRAGSQTRPPLPLHRHLQELRQSGRRVARSLVFAADRPAHRPARGARRDGRRARALRGEGTMRVLRHHLAGFARRTPADRRERRHGGDGAIRATISVRDLDPAEAASGAVRGHAAP